MFEDKGLSCGQKIESHWNLRCRRS